MQLDHTDRLILDALAADARASMSALAERTHLSRAAVHARFKRLTEAGVITGFFARVDPLTAGLHSTAFVTLTLDSRRWQTAYEQIRQLAGVAYIAVVSGAADVLVLVRARNNRELRRMVLCQLHDVPGVLSTHTMIVFDECDRAPCWSELLATAAQQSG